jgi:hypothetical protein
MENNNETGHNKTVLNFESLLITPDKMGSLYNPPNDILKKDYLWTLLVKGKDVLNNVANSSSAYNMALYNREMAFARFNALITRSNYILQAIDSTKILIAKAGAIIRKLRGGRAGVKYSEEELKTMAAEGKELKQKSVSQMSYDNRIENLDLYINFLSTLPQYTPNEEDIQVAGLRSYCDDLRNLNVAVKSALVDLNNARGERDKVLYDPETGMVAIANDVKKYIKAVLGTNNPQSEQVARLIFKNIH